MDLHKVKKVIRGYGDTANSMIYYGQKYMIVVFPCETMLSNTKCYLDKMRKEIGYGLQGTH